MNYEKLTSELIDWVKDWFNDASPKSKAVIGVSGGAKSYIVTALMVQALGSNRVIGVCSRSDKSIEEDLPSFRQCEYFKIAKYHLPIFTAVNVFNNLITLNCQIKPSLQAEQNLIPRLRMAALYAISQSIGGRVVNTACLSDYFIGNVTFGGDSIGDICPFGMLTCTEMIYVGKELGLKDEIVNIKPDDHLIGSYPDEEKFKFTYEVLDRYIRTGEIEDEKIKEKIHELHYKNIFKFVSMPCNTFKPNLPIIVNE